MGEDSPREKGISPLMIVKILRAECCGNALCAEAAPAVFALDSKNKSTVLDPDAVTPEKLQEIAEACPCQAIVVEDDEGNQLLP